MRGSEGHAIIATDVGGQAALLKKPFKCGKSVVFPGGRKRLTREEKTAGVIGDRQRIAILDVQELHLSLPQNDSRPQRRIVGHLRALSQCFGLAL